MLTFFTLSDVLYLDVMVLVMRQENFCRIEGKHDYNSIVYVLLRFCSGSAFLNRYVQIV